MDFTAIDFETANRRSDSACQFGAVVVRGGEIVGRHQWLIRPRPFFFDAGNIRIHGIRPEQVAGELEFDERWDEIWSVLSGDCLVAHNAVFDVRVMQGCLKTHEIPIPDFNFTCTRMIARRAWPQWQGYGLAVIAERLGITFRHHDALEDAVACAQVLLTAAERSNVASLQELDRRLEVQRGTCGPGGFQDVRSRSTSAPHRTFSSRMRRRSSAFTRSNYTAGRSPAFATSVPSKESRVSEQADDLEEGLDLERLRAIAETLKPWTGKHVVFTGVLTQMQRYQAEFLAECMGARCQNGVTGKTNVVVIGELDQRTLAAERSQSVKEEEARRRAQEGQAIEFLREDDFLQIFAQQESNRGL